MAVFRNSYITWSKRLNTHLLSILFATTSGAALNIATGSVSNAYHVWAIVLGIVATLAAFTLFLRRTKIDDAISNDNEDFTWDEKFKYHCGYKRPGTRIRFWGLIIIFLSSFSFIVAFMYLGAVQANEQDAQSQRELLANSLRQIAEEMRKQQIILEAQQSAIVALTDELKKHGSREALCTAKERDSMRLKRTYNRRPSAIP